jgi:uncharacterized membrane protein (UPF0127 family)
MRERVCGNNWRTSLILALSIALPAAAVDAAQAGYNCAAGQASQINIGTQQFVVSVADSPAKRQLGLSGRRELAMNSGMWFEFEYPGWHGFWMQDMKFPIDLIWVAPEGRVLGAITLSTCTEKSCRIYTPPGPVAYVLEINAGVFAGKAGDAVTWSCSPAEWK